jgi:hypothetical protein
MQCLPTQAIALVAEITPSTLGDASMRRRLPYSADDVAAVGLELLPGAGSVPFDLSISHHCDSYQITRISYPILVSSWFLCMLQLLLRSHFPLHVIHGERSLFRVILIKVLECIILSMPCNWLCIAICIAHKMRIMHAVA